jgi:hypothetical protein
MHLIYDDMNVFFNDDAVPGMSGAELSQIKVNNYDHDSICHYVVFAKDSEYDQYYGWNFEGNSRSTFVVFLNKIKDKTSSWEYPDYVSAVFQHEYGHALGMKHYNPDWEDWEPHVPGKTSMRMGTLHNYNKYLKEDSNTMFTYDDGVVKTRVFGGWEYTGDMATVFLETEFHYWGNGGTPWGPGLSFNSLSHA